MLYRTCSLPALARGLPNCAWSFLTTPSSAELLERERSLAEVLPLVDARTGRIMRGGVGQLRRADFDVALCTNTFRIDRDLLLALRLRVPARVAFSMKGMSGLITHPIRVRAPSPYPEYFRIMVATVTGLHPDWPLRPRILWTDADDHAASAHWTALSLGTRPVLVCAPGTRQKQGVASAGLFASILSELSRRFEGDIVLCGARDERALLERIARDSGTHSRISAGILNVRALAAFLARCAFALTQDSGPRHIANAAGIPVAFFRNLAVPRVETGVYCETETDLSPPDELVGAKKASRLYEAIDPAGVAATISLLIVNAASTSAQTSAAGMRVRQNGSEYRQLP